MRPRIRHARWRTWLRVHTPDILYYRLHIMVPKAEDCGDHDWYAEGSGWTACYHCKVRRPTTVPNANPGLHDLARPGGR